MIRSRTHLPSGSSGGTSGGLVSVTDYRVLAVGDNWTAAVSAAFTKATLTGTGIWFPSPGAGGPAEYQLGALTVPEGMTIRAQKGAIIAPYGQLVTMFSVTAGDVEFEGLNCRGVGSMSTNSGVGAVITCQLEDFGGGDYGLQAGADSDNDDASIPLWTGPGTSYTGPSYPGATDADRVRRPVALDVWACLVDHVSSATMDEDIDADRWVHTTAGMEVRRGGSGYVATHTDGDGDYFDYAVTDKGGTGGVIRCYVVGGAITRALTISSGSGYDEDIGDVRLIMVIGRSYPEVWISGSDCDMVKVTNSRFQFGKRAVTLSDVNYAHVEHCRADDMGPNCNAFNYDNCTFSYAHYLTVINGFGGTHNPAGIRISGHSGGATKFLSIQHCYVNGVDIGGVGIGANIGEVFGLNISHNSTENCEAIGMEIKHGIHAGGSSPGQVPEALSGVHGIVYVGNYCRVNTGSSGIRYYNNLRDAFHVELGPSNVVECVGEKANPDTGQSTLGVVVKNASNSNISPTIRGKFGQGIQIQTAFNTVFAPLTDGRSAILIYAPDGSNYSLHTCRFPGEYLATSTAVRLDSATKPIFNGTRAIVRGQPFSSITITAPGTGGPISQTIPVYANGGGYGLQLKATVVNGALTAVEIAPANTEDFKGANYFDGGDGTFLVHVKQNGGTGGILEVTVVDGQATGVVVNTAGSGYLEGGSTTTGEGLLIEMGADFVGTVTTGVSGEVVSTAITDFGGHFVQAPTLAFEAGITWGTPPTLTPIKQSSSVAGAVLGNVYGGQISGAYFEGAQNGIRTLGQTVIGLNINNSEFRAANGPPLNIEGTTFLGICKDVTQIYGAGIVPLGRLPSTNVYCSIGESNLILTSGAAQLIKTITGLRGETTFRISHVNFALTFDATGNIDLGGATSITLSATTDFARFRWNENTGKAKLISYGGDVDAVTQATSKSTTVILNSLNGRVTMDAASLGANTAVSFTLTNAAIAARDLIMVTHESAGTLGSYNVTATAGTGSATVTVRNVTAGALGEAIVLRFMVMKAPAR